MKSTCFCVAVLFYIQDFQVMHDINSLLPTEDIVPIATTQKNLFKNWVRIQQYAATDFHSNCKLALIQKSK